jgi:hypothetical protein
MGETIGNDQKYLGDKIYRGLISARTSRLEGKRQHFTSKWSYFIIQTRVTHKGANESIPEEVEIFAGHELYME